jgi:hypothetical protein
MLSAFLQATFARLNGGLAAWNQAGGGSAPNAIDFSQAVEHVVDETYPRLRMAPGYARRLRGPVENAFRYIDELVESIPPAILCCRSNYVSDPQVNAFFAGPDHIQKVFSESEEVRSLFDSSPDVCECWALLCMRKEERRQFGMDLAGDDVRREVLQTGVSFTDHQIVSPGVEEADARRALKCCIFNSLLGYARRRAKTAKETALELGNRRKALQGRLTRASDEHAARELQAQIDQLEQGLAQESLKLVTLNDHLEFVAEVLGNPAQYVSRGGHDLRLSRLGIKLEGQSDKAGYEVPLAEIHVACHEPRIAALVRFRRDELLARHDYLRKADLFLVA